MQMRHYTKKLKNSQELYIIIKFIYYSCLSNTLYMYSYKAIMQKFLIFTDFKHKQHDDLD